MIGDVRESISEAVSGAVGRTLGRAQERRELPRDLLESDEAYLVVFDAPGVEADDVGLTYEDRQLTVHVERFRPLRESFEMEFPGRGLSLAGRAELPDGPPVAATRATATLKRNGTLFVRLPKAEGVDHGDDADTAADTGVDRDSHSGSDSDSNSTSDSGSDGDDPDDGGSDGTQSTEPTDR